MKNLLLLVALISPSLIQSASAATTPISKLIIKPMGLKPYKHDGHESKCIILSVQNIGTKTVTFPVVNSKNSLVPNPYYTYEIKAKGQKSWVPFNQNAGSFLYPKVFNSVRPQKTSSICVQYTSWPKDSAALKSNSLIRLQIRDMAGQSHATESFYSTGLLKD